MSGTPKKKALILRSFTDAGTSESFEANTTPMIDAGAYANYEAAGLVGAPPAAVARPKKPAAKKPAARTPAPVPAAPPADTGASAASEGSTAT